MQLHFILVEPQVPENVGAAARAIKTMGFTQLRLVNSDLHQDERASWLAHGAGDILEQTRSFPDLAAALADMDLVIGTSAKPRHGRQASLAPDDVRALLGNKGSAVARAAVVFGREDRGLSNTELALCDLVTSIPLAQPYPSLNLAQAVMLYAWELSSLNAAQEPALAAEAGQYRALRSRVAALLNQLERVPDSKLYDWALERLALLSENDVHFMHTLCQSLERALSR